jgi:hypothetical protein
MKSRRAGVEYAGVEYAESEAWIWSSNASASTL